MSPKKTLKYHFCLSLTQSKKYEKMTKLIPQFFNLKIQRCFLSNLLVQYLLKLQTFGSKLLQLCQFAPIFILQFIMESLKKQNQELRKAIESILQEIERQKELNAQHQTEIETLLKFNERLLSIIENELNNKKDTCSLQPISERSQRESDLIGPALNSSIRSRKLVARSQRGFDTHNSLVQQVRKTNNKLNDIFKQKDGLKSQLDKSYDNDDLSERKIQFKTTSGGVSPAQDKKQNQSPKKAEIMKKTIQQSEQVKQEMSQGIADLKKFRNDGARFYDSKIKEIKGLSSKLNSYKPSEQLKNITQKLSLSQSTSQLLQKTMKKGEIKK